MAEKITMQTPIVEMDGDEMTRLMWAQIKEELIAPFVDLKTEYYDLGLPERERTDDGVTMEAAKAVEKWGVGVKCATITPNAKRMEEYHLSRMYPSPNGTIRAYLDGTTFRAPILLPGAAPLVSCWKEPITIARHSYGDLYKGTEYRVPGPGAVKLTGSGADKTIFDFKGPGVVMGMYNTDDSIRSFARSCFACALDKGQDLWFSCKDTISQTYDGRFRDIFQEVYDGEYKDRFAAAGITYFYTLIDDAVARCMRSQGGFVWALKNYDGDVMSDMIGAAFGALALMSSVLISPSGRYVYEAAHGTVTRHWYRRQQGEKTSTDPMATIFAWAGALRKRGELDGLADLQAFGDRLEQASLQAIGDGVVTKDMAALTGAETSVDTETFLSAVRARLG
ncbi:MAG: NADP-dependent isocitrate dehydrogenase [Oscillospiraceae bacterium]|nr:NADP-dependent isocitrate dehydrogenase [Oscillospiraceae bacterium]